MIIAVLRQSIWGKKPVKHLTNTALPTSSDGKDKTLCGLIVTRSSDHYADGESLDLALPGLCGRCVSLYTNHTLQRKPR